MQGGKELLNAAEVRRVRAQIFEELAKPCSQSWEMIEMDRCLCPVNVLEHGACLTSLNRPVENL